jgi:3-oxoacyl-[acyl-carrier protein] reductase
MDIKNKHVIVTGGVSGFGRGLVDKLIEKEAQVGIFDINAAGFIDFKDQDNVTCYECDITDPDAIAAAVDAFCDEHKTINVLVNNAGILYSAPLINIFGGLKRHSFDDWDKVIATNLSSVFYMTATVVGKMVVTRTKGLVINVSSISAAGNPGQTAYSAAKAAINALTSTWAKELSPLNIRVAGIAPGFSDTPSTHEAMSETALKEVIKRIPAKRLGTPEEIVQGMLFIIENDFFNGKILELDGGLVI